MKAIIKDNSRIIKVLESKLNKDIHSIRESEDEDCIYFADGTSTYCIIEFIFDDEIQVQVTILDNFEATQNFKFNY
jgi:DeoR/GlpR family transcriptional regulator of sugar metabolism